nr:hypothetical protein [uncultured bacterium]
MIAFDGDAEFTQTIERRGTVGRSGKVRYLGTTVRECTDQCGPM